MSKARARAKITFEVEIPDSSTWGDGCTVGQVTKQAKDSARHTAGQIVLRMGKPSGLQGDHSPIEMRVLRIEKRISIDIEEEED